MNEEALEHWVDAPDAPVLARAGVHAVLLALTSLVAAASPPVVVAADGCPSAADVVRSLRELLPGRSIAPLSADANAVHVQISDDGATYRLTFGDIDRVLDDPQRRCGDRARAAAIVIQLALEPPTLTEPLPAQRRGPYVDLGVAGLFGIAPDLSSGGVLLAGGAHLRVNAGWRWLGATLGVGALSPTVPHFAPYHYSLRRVPIDVGLYLAWRGRAFEIGGELGVVLAPLLIEGSDLSPSRSSLRFEGGLRLRPEARWWARSWLAVTAAFTCDVAFRPYQLEVTPTGRIGHTPRVWTGLELGLLFRIKNSEEF